MHPSRFATVLVAGFLTTMDARGADPRHFDDASLRAIQFIDAKEGWAVGDDGVIWHTIDGGQAWERQPTGTRASLRSVCFLDPYLGWAVGREELPSGGSVGVVLFTRDGGVAWKRLLVNALPGLNQVRFVNNKVGFLLADGADQFPSGLFKTVDGGKTWDPVRGPRTPGWLGADFHDGDTGILVGPWKSLLTLKRGGFGKANLDELGDLGARNLHAVQMLQKRVVAVGDGGLILTSATGGAAWGFADLKLPKDVAACLDFRAIHGVGPKAWVAGRPGSFVLSTTDAGATWTMGPTGHTTPLHGLFFLDDQRGWAVGDLGAILKTDDGGATWKTLRRGGQRSAALFVNARAEDVPLDTIAALGGDGGYLAAALRVVAHDPATAPLERAGAPLRLAAATRLAGGVTAESLWHFTLPPHLRQAGKPAVLAHWHLGHGNRADRELLRQLVLALRIWRPEVVITDAIEGKHSHAAGALIAEALHEAVKQAADASAFPEQIETLGLATWHVKKLYAQGDGAVQQDNHEPRPRLEGTLREFVAPAARLLHAHHPSEGTAPIPARRGFRLLHGTLAGAENQPQLMLGVSGSAGESRRTLEAEPQTDPVRLDAIRQRRHLLALAENLDQHEKTLAQLGPMLRQLPDELAAPTAFAVADLYARRGQWDFAREAYLFLVDRYPSHPHAADAYRWLIRHITSSEVRRRYDLEQVVTVKNYSFHGNMGGPKPNLPGGIQLVKGVDNAPPSQMVFLSQRAESREWYKGGLEFGKRFAAFGPLYATDPETQFCLQAAKRNLGDLDNPAGWYERFRSHVTRGPWHDAAQAELWLANRAGSPPRRLALCRLTDRRPHLDAKLDDPCWQGLKSLVLENASGATAADSPTEARFAYDQEFLYVALHCRHPEGQQAPLVKSRPRDADLEGHDRVSILFDLDRDYATYFQVQVDQRGCVREDCWGDASWNPKLYVAARNDETSWSVEMAIPLGELTGQRVALGSAWACNLVRTLPGRGVQAFSLPADATPRPEGMCLLLFQQDPARHAAQPMTKAP
ncbi:MAG: YCF48-related protein [Gemmataceae bacterium]|nr:YCF48-related protein [Gemmataceae bacterium]